MVKKNDKMVNVNEKELELLDIKLQLFAEDDEGNDNDGNNNDASDNDNDSTDDKDLDIDKILNHPKFQKILNSHADKRVTDATKKIKKKHEDELKRKDMSAEEIIQAKEKELAQRELKLSKIELFKSKSYDLDLLDYVDGSDIEEIEEKSEKIIATINKLVEKQVAERLKGSSYTPPDGKGKGTVDLDNMSMAEYEAYWNKQQK